MTQRTLGIIRSCRRTSIVVLINTAHGLHYRSTFFCQNIFCFIQENFVTSHSSLYLPHSNTYICIQLNYRYLPFTLEPQLKTQSPKPAVLLSTNMTYEHMNCTNNINALTYYKHTYTYNDKHTLCTSFSHRVTPNQARTPRPR